MTQQTWVLAADDVCARFFVREDGYLKSIADLVAESPVETEITNRTIGRTGSSKTERHKYEPSAAQSHQAEIAFAQRVAAVVNDAAAREAFDDLVVVAAPQMLGYLRRSLDDHARAHISAEIDKEFANLADRKLQDKLMAILHDPDLMNQRKH